MGKVFMLNDLLRFSANEQKEYKLHLGRRNEDGIEPYDEFCKGFQNWIGWQEWRGWKNDFPRKFIFSVFKDYHTEDQYIFGGIFDVIARPGDYAKTQVGYNVELLPQYSALIGRMVLRLNCPPGPRGRAFNLESYLDNFEIVEILSKSISER